NMATGSKAGMPLQRLSKASGPRCRTCNGPITAISCPRTVPAASANGHSAPPIPTAPGPRCRAWICSGSGMAGSSRNRPSASSARRFRPRLFRQGEAAMQAIPKRAGSVDFDPFYDPMTAPVLGPRSDYAPSYWIGTAGPAPEDDGPVTGDMDADVVVIGSGYTGLSCAIHLAKMHGIKATVLEANGVAYGCSTRNGGQAQISSGRLKRSQWIDRWGLDVAKGLHREVCEAFDLFRAL